MKPSNNSTKNTPINSQIEQTNYRKSYLLPDDLKNGGTLQLEMSNEPNKNWGSSEVMC
ncbi:MAG: hypothetical protein IPH78_13310, partial [Bacteroidetes bacterium]|nr:hypothetical protein [Bacteroidota bacterium]